MQTLASHRLVFGTRSVAPQHAKRTCCRQRPGAVANRQTKLTHTTQHSLRNRYAVSHRAEAATLSSLFHLHNIALMQLEPCMHAPGCTWLHKGTCLKMRDHVVDGRATVCCCSASTYSFPSRLCQACTVSVSVLSGLSLPAGAWSHAATAAAMQDRLQERRVQHKTTPAHPAPAMSFPGRQSSLRHLLTMRPSRRTSVIWTQISCRPHLAWRLLLRTISSQHSKCVHHHLVLKLKKQ
jgi:hypothetical protein